MAASREALSHGGAGDLGHEGLCEVGEKREEEMGNTE
jgi:hypothetical protein